MARQVVVPLLLLFAMTGLALAQKHATPSVLASTPPASSPSSDDGIGIGDGTPLADDVEPAPVGGPVPPGAFSPAAESPEPKGSGANCLKNVGVTGALVATAVAGFFSF